MTDRNMTSVISGRLNSRRETHPQRTHGIVGICWGRHLGLRLLLLWQSGEVNRTPTVSLKINCHSRTTSCPSKVVWPTEVEASITIIVMSVTLEQTTVTGGLAIVVVTVM